MSRTAPMPAPRRAVKAVDPTASYSAQVNAAANELNLLEISPRDPEDFFVRKNQLVVRLRALSRTMAGEAAPIDMTTFHGVGHRKTQR